MLSPVQHAVANYLSRLDSGEPRIGIHDDFLDAQLFQVETEKKTEVDEDIADLWIIEMTKFLSTRLPHPMNGND